MKGWEGGGGGQINPPEKSTFKKPSLLGLTGKCLLGTLTIFNVLVYLTHSVFVDVVSVLYFLHVGLFVSTTMSL